MIIYIHTSKSQWQVNMTLLFANSMLIWTSTVRQLKADWSNCKAENISGSCCSSYFTNKTAGVWCGYKTRSTFPQGYRSCGNCVDGLDRSQIVIPFSCVSGHTQICSCVLFIINPLGKYVSFASASRRAKQWAGNLKHKFNKNSSIASQVTLRHRFLTSSLVCFN